MTADASGVSVAPGAGTADGPVAGPVAAVDRADLFRYVLRLGDDALVLAHRLSEWISNAPQIEEDIALGNIGLDLLGQARALLTYAGECEGAGRTEDDLAYLREDRAFTNLQIVEIPNGDFAVTMARQLAFAAYQVVLYERLAGSADATLAAIAAKAVKEVAYHLDHARQWVIRLGDGTDESHARMQAGLAAVWPFVPEMLAGDDLDRAMAQAGVGVDPAELRPAWERQIDAVLAEATLEVPATTWIAKGGRDGIHTEALGYLLAEMQVLHRAHPGATW